MKTFRSASDLAINGAAPAFAEPLHVGRPNIGDREEFLRRINAMLDRRWVTNNGPLVQELEQRIENRLKVRHCVAMCNGTIALEIAIRAVGLSGEVIIPSYTFIATAHALHWQGITPVFADIDPGTHNLDPTSVESLITPRTTGIIGVHLWGRPSPHDALRHIAAKHGLKLIYDAAHAFGCTYHGIDIGNLGECEVLSFHATKCFNTFEGGAVVTNNDDLAERMRLMRNFGFAGYDNVIYPGTNGKMTEISAAMGLTNLESLDQIIAANKTNHATYCTHLSGVRGLRILDYNPEEANNYQYVVAELGPEFPVSRDHLVAILHAENILARKYFWPGCHNMQPYRDLFPLSHLALRHTEQVSRNVIVLPTGSTVSTGDVECIAELIAFVGSGKT